MQIRPYTEDDIPEISRLYYNTVHRVNSRDYSPEQIRAWVPALPAGSWWKNRFRSRQVYVAVDAGMVIGFVEFTMAGHIDCFYVHHMYQRRGVGRALMAVVDEEFHNSNVHRVYAEVSITAVPFFQGMGFQAREERNLDYNGVNLRLYLMEKYY